MGKAVRWRFCTKTSRADRVRQRTKVVLRDAGLSEKTQERYYLGVRKVLPILLRSRDLVELDEKVADWVQQRWEKATANTRSVMPCAHYTILNLGCGESYRWRGNY